MAAARGVQGRETERIIAQIIAGAGLGGRNERLAAFLVASIADYSRKGGFTTYKDHRNITTNRDMRVWSIVDIDVYQAIREEAARLGMSWVSYVGMIITDAMTPHVEKRRSRKYSH